MLRCYNCEALDCPQEDIDNLQSRLIRARKGKFPESL